MYYIYIHCIIKQYVSWELFNYRFRQFLSTEHLLILTILILSHLAGRLNCILNSFPTLFFFDCFPNCIFANKTPFKSVRFHFTADIDVSTIKKRKRHKILFYVTLKDIARESPCIKKFCIAVISSTSWKILESSHAMIWWKYLEIKSRLITYLG